MAYIDDFLADKTRRKVVVTGIIAGGAALAAGFGRAIDKKFPGYKRTSDTSYLFMRGALIGGLLSLPAASYAANMGSTSMPLVVLSALCGTIQHQNSPKDIWPSRMTLMEPLISYRLLRRLSEGSDANKPTSLIGASLGEAHKWVREQMVFSNPGKPMADYTLKNQDGLAISLSDLTKVVLLMLLSWYWFYTQKPCFTWRACWVYESPSNAPQSPYRPHPRRHYARALQRNGKRIRSVWSYTDSFDSSYPPCFSFTPSHSENHRLIRARRESPYFPFTSCPSSRRKITE